MPEGPLQPEGKLVPPMALSPFGGIVDAAVDSRVAGAEVDELILSARGTMLQMAPDVEL